MRSLIVGLAMVSILPVVGACGDHLGSHDLTKGMHRACIDQRELTVVSDSHCAGLDPHRSGAKNGHLWVYTKDAFTQGEKVRGKINYYGSQSIKLGR